VPPRHWWGGVLCHPPTPAPKFALSPERAQLSSEGATEAGPVLESRSKTRPSVGPRRGRPVWMSSHHWDPGQGRGRRTFSPFLPAPKVLAKIAWDNHAALSALPLSADWESTLSAGCCSANQSPLGAEASSPSTQPPWGAGEQQLCPPAPAEMLPTSLSPRPRAPSQSL